MKTKFRFYHLFTFAFYRQKDVFKLFRFSTFKVVLYFFILNLMMLFPLSYGIISMDEMNFDLIDFDLNEDVPAWLPGDLPACHVEQLTLQCADTQIHIRYFDFMEETYELQFNVPEGIEADRDYTIFFKENHIKVHMRDNISLTLDYRGFEGLNFSDVNTMEQSQGASLMLNAFFKSLHPHIVLPLLILTVGGLIAMNLFLLLIFSALAMFFRFIYSDVPPYHNTFKLFVIASSIPAVINLGLGFFGLSAFTSIVYNFLTPLIVLIIYKKNVARIEDENLAMK